MSNQEMKNQIFEVMLQAAIKESFEKEVLEYPSADILTEEYDLSLATHRKIEKMIRDSRQKLTQLRIQKAAKKAAVIAAITIPVSIFGLFSVDASRNAIFNALLEWKADHLDIKYEDKNSKNSSSPSTGTVLKPKYIPEGFVEDTITKSGSYYNISYINSEGNLIILRTFSLKKEGVFSVDTENTTQKQITINGIKANIFEANRKEDCSYLIWNSQNKSFVLSSNISVKELISMAESMLK